MKISEYNIKRKIVDKYMKEDIESINNFLEFIFSERYDKLIIELNVRSETIPKGSTLSLGKLHNKALSYIHDKFNFNLIQDSYNIKTNDANNIKTDILEWVEWEIKGEEYELSPDKSYQVKDLPEGFSIIICKYYTKFQTYNKNENSNDRPREIMSITIPNDEIFNKWDIKLQRFYKDNLSCGIKNIFTKIYSMLKLDRKIKIKELLK